MRLLLSIMLIYLGVFPPRGWSENNLRAADCQVRRERKPSYGYLSQLRHFRRNTTCTVCALSLTTSTISRDFILRFSAARTHPSHGARIASVWPYCFPLASSLTTSTISRDFILRFSAARTHPSHGARIASVWPYCFPLASP
jgi:hypothetical protein